MVREKDSPDTIKVSEGKHEEYLVTRHGQFDPPINIINLYGAQESRLTTEQIQRNWEAILEELLEIATINQFTYPGKQLSSILQFLVLNLCFKEIS